MLLRFGQSTAVRFIKESIRVRGSSLRNRHTSTIASGFTRTHGSCFAGCKAPTLSPNFAARTCWISSGVMRPSPTSLCGYLVLDAQAGLGFADLAPPREPALADDLVLHPEKPFGERLGPRRATRHVDVDGDDLVDAFAHRVGELEEPAAVRAASHADDVLRLGHLLVEELAPLRHLVGERPCHDHEIALARRRPGHRAEPIDVRPGTARLHELDAAAGEAEEQVEDRALPGQVDDVIDEGRAGRDDLAHVLRIVFGHRSSEVRRASGCLAGLLARLACRLQDVLLEALYPFQVAHRPDVCEPDGEDGDEYEDLDEGEEALPAFDEGPVHRGDRVHERDLDLEDHEYERNQVEAGIEVVPGAPDGLLAALVDHLLLRRGIARTEEMAREERSEDEQDREQGEDDYVGEVEGHCFSPLFCKNSTGFESLRRGGSKSRRPSARKAAARGAKRRRFSEVAEGRKLASGCGVRPRPARWTGGRAGARASPSLLRPHRSVLS